MRRFGVGLACVGLAALLLRIIHVHSILESPIGSTLVADARFYHQEAGRILGLFPPDRAPGVPFMNVGYPYALALLYAFLGMNVASVLWVQSALGAMTAVLLAIATRSLLGSERSALCAGLLYAFYDNAIFYDALLLTPSLTSLFIGLAMVAFAAHLKRGGIPSAATAGGALGMAVLLRANLMLLVACFAGILFIRPAERGARFAPAAAMCIAAAFLPLTVVASNGWIHGDWVPLSANGGMNFWVGNNLASEGVYYPAAFINRESAAEERDGFLLEARRRMGEPTLSLGGASGYWLRQGLRDVRADVPRWLRLELRKLGLFWNQYETKTNVGLEFFRGFSTVLSTFSIGFGMIALLGVAGFVILLAHPARDAALLGSVIVLVPLATCLAFFVSGEYRHPAGLGLCLAGSALLSAPARRRSAIQRASALIAAMLVVPLIAWRYPSVEAGGDASMDYLNYSAAMSFPKPDGERPRAEDFARARLLLEHAPERISRNPILGDAWLWLRYRAAVELKDPAEAALALEIADRLTTWLVSRDQERPSDPFRSQLAVTIPGRIADLAGQEFLSSDPGIKARAARILSRIPIDGTTGPARFRVGASP